MDPRRYLLGLLLDCRERHGGGADIFSDGGSLHLMALARRGRRGGERDGRAGAVVILKGGTLNLDPGVRGGVGLFTPDNTWSTFPLSCIDQCPCQAKLWLLASLHTTLHSVVALWCVLMIRTHWRCGKRKRGSGVTETPLVTAADQELGKWT